VDRAIPDLRRLTERLAGQRVTGLAYAGLAIVLFLLAGSAIWASKATKGATVKLDQAISESTLFAAARHGVQDEDFLVTESLLALGPEVGHIDMADVRRRHDSAAARTRKALQSIARNDKDLSDRDVVRRLLGLHGRYVSLAGALFDAVDARNAERALAIEVRQIDRIFPRLEELIIAKANEHDRRAARHLATLDRTESIAFVGTLVVFGTGLLLLAGLGLLLELARRGGEARRVELARLESEKHTLDAQNVQLRELDRMKDDFVAAVSHELRTPLTSIRGYLELVIDEEAGTLTDEQQQFLGIVQRNAERLLRVVGDLLFVAQVDAGTLHLERAGIDVNTLAEQALFDARPAAEAKQIELRFDGAGTPELAGDPARIGQMLDNLVSNAIKFTPAGGRVDVRAFSHRDHAVIEVADTGIGIARAEHERMFERFFRTRAATEAAIQGTGLGLAIAKAVAEAHGGTISFESDEGAGTTFRVELPLARQPVRA
jgi:signal transduction histidine kinase